MRCITYEWQVEKIFNFDWFFMAFTAYDLAFQLPLKQFRNKRLFFIGEGYPCQIAEWCLHQVVHKRKQKFLSVALFAYFEHAWTYFIDQ